MSLNQKNTESLRSFSRRAVLLSGAQLGFLGLLGGRLAWLQAYEGHKYKTLAEKNRINVKMLAPSRGIILDRNGQPLASNTQDFRLIIVPEQVEDLQRTLRVIRQHVEISDAEAEDFFRRAGRSASFIPIKVKDNLNWDEVARIEVNLPDLPGVSIEVGEKRIYPPGEAVAHIVGYVGAVSRGELGENPIYSLPGFKTGKTAIEKGFEERLRGKTGMIEVEVNAMGREIRELGKKEGQPGDTIILSVDLDLQKDVQRRLDREKSASAVIMDAKTGAVYAMASSPAFDPNIFTQGLSHDTWERLLSTPGHPLTNKAVAGQYPPGSVFKMVTGLAALEEGIVNRHTRFHCPGHYEFGGHRFHCWKSSGHGSVDMIDALSESCDTYFYHIARALGIEKLSAMAHKLGLGEKLGFNLAEERPGLMPDKDWKMGHLGQSWKAGETIVAGIGQGYILATPLQLGVMMARLLNDGLAVNPWMVGYVGAEKHHTRRWPSLGFNSANLDLIKAGMDKAVNHRQGTAFGSRITEAGMQMGGKTGTAQVKRITMAQRREGFKAEDLPWKHRHHALFSGYAPVNDPRYIVSVVVEHGGGGSSAAAPLARDILLAAQRRAPADKNIDSSFLAENAAGKSAVQKGRL